MTKRTQLSNETYSSSKCVDRPVRQPLRQHSIRRQSISGSQLLTGLPKPAFQLGSEGPVLEWCRLRRRREGRQLCGRRQRRHETRAVTGAPAVNPIHAQDAAKAGGSSAGQHA